MGRYTRVDLDPRRRQNRSTAHKGRRRHRPSSSSSVCFGDSGFASCNDGLPVNPANHYSPTQQQTWRSCTMGGIESHQRKRERAVGSFFDCSGYWIGRDAYVATNHNKSRPTLEARGRRRAHMTRGALTLGLLFFTGRCSGEGRGRKRKPLRLQQRSKQKSTGPRNHLGRGVWFFASLKSGSERGRKLECLKE
jgi:hypothetical protein